MTPSKMPSGLHCAIRTNPEAFANIPRMTIHKRQRRKVNRVPVPTVFVEDEVAVLEEALENAEIIGEQDEIEHSGSNFVRAEHEPLSAERGGSSCLEDDIPLEETTVGTDASVLAELRAAQDRSLHVPLEVQEVLRSVDPA